MAEYKLSGNDKEVAKIIRENQIRVDRGLVTFTPCTTMDFDDKHILVVDDKSVPATEDMLPATDDKKHKPHKKTKPE